MTDDERAVPQGDHERRRPAALERCGEWEGANEGSALVEDGNTARPAIQHDDGVTGQQGGSVHLAVLAWSGSAAAGRAHDAAPGVEESQLMRSAVHHDEATIPPWEDRRDAMELDAIRAADIQSA